MKTTVYSFAKRLMADEEFNMGGIIENEQKYLDAIGFPYHLDEDGCVQTDGDTNTFYEAMITIWKLHQKYSGK